VEGFFAARKIRVLFATKTFAVTGRGGPKEAIKLLKEAMKRQQEKQKDR